MLTPDSVPPKPASTQGARCPRFAPVLWALTWELSGTLPFAPFEGRRISPAVFETTANRP
jgi:hypothetical protein